MKRAVVVLSVALVGSAVLYGRCSSRSSTGKGAVDAGTVATAIPADYPADVKPDPVAARLCEALHALPGKRVAECCGGPPVRQMTDACTRVLSASLADGAVRVDWSRVDACAASMTRSLEGCDWVTPSQPVPPRECRGIVEGQLAVGARCRSELDCKEGLHCAAGVCASPEPDGAPCGRTVDKLAAETRQTNVDVTHPTCAEHCSLVTHKCEASPKIGARCFANVGCSKGQLCVDGQCAEATAGRLGLPCVGGTCEDGLRCVSGTCRAKAAPGERCANDFDCAKGGCASDGDGRVCAMTCTHARDLDAIRRVLAAPPPADRRTVARAPR